MVPNRTMNGALLDALKDRITVLAPVEITGFSAGPARATLTLKDGETVEATLVVASDGANSALRGMAGIGVIAHDYRQMGVVTTIGHELPHEGVAYEHFLPAGPFASLPLKGNRSSLVWTETPARAAELKALSAEDAALAIEAAMGSSLGLVTVEEPLQAFPLKLQIAREFVAPRLALIGDAAHVIHPVAGQGLNLGLKDVAALAEAVIEAMRLGLDFGAADVLARYERWRRFDTALMAMVTDGMNRLFSNDVAPVRALRDLGLGRRGPHAAGERGADRAGGGRVEKWAAVACRGWGFSSRLASPLRGGIKGGGGSRSVAEWATIGAALRHRAWAAPTPVPSPQGGGRPDCSVSRSRPAPASAVPAPRDRSPAPRRGSASGRRRGSERRAWPRPRSARYGRPRSRAASWSAGRPAFRGF